MQYRDYQLNISDQAVGILREHRIVYLAMQVRTGKTLTSLRTAELYGAASVLFLTKKKAISSIQSDYDRGGFNYDIEIVNYESIHKVDRKIDFVIIDEAHRLGAFPKPSQATKTIKENYSHLPIVLMSGTPSPESFSQLYHQFYVSNNTPFSDYKTFYQWAKVFVSIKQRTFGYGVVNDYSMADEQKINRIIDKLMIDFTQEEAGFVTKVTEHKLYVKMRASTYKVANDLLRDKVVEGKTDVILADTAVKLQNKLHQIYSGTCIGESGDVIYLDDSKARFIFERFKGKKLGIFYKFKGELELLKKIFGWQLTECLDEFNMGEQAKSIALQIVTGREGISLARADYLVYFNIDFSAVSYWQSRDRLTTKERKENEMFWIFSEGGIEDKIYKVLRSKKKYTLNHFQKDYRV